MINKNNCIPYIEFLYIKKHGRRAPEEVLNSWIGLEEIDLARHLENLYFLWNLDKKSIEELESEFEIVANNSNVEASSEKSLYESRACESANVEDAKTFQNTKTEIGFVKEVLTTSPTRHLGKVVWVSLSVILVTSVLLYFIFSNNYSIDSTLVDQFSKVNIESKFQKVGGFSEGLVVVKLNDKYGFVDTSGKEVIPMIYDFVLPFKNGLACVASNGKFGSINTEGNVVIPLRYDKAFKFTKGIAEVQLNGNLNYIDTNGQYIIQHRKEGINSSEEKAGVQVGNQNEVAWNNRRSKINLEKLEPIAIEKLNKVPNKQGKISANTTINENTRTNSTQNQRRQISEVSTLEKGISANQIDKSATKRNSVEESELSGNHGSDRSSLNFSGGISGRTIVAKPDSRVEGMIKGTVAVKVYADCEGTIIRYTVQSAANSELLAVVAQTIRRIKFNKSKDAPLTQSGVLYLKFR